MLKHLLVLVSFSIAATSSQAVTYNVDLIQQHQQWMSARIYLGQDIFFRGTVMNGGAQLAIDIPKNLCDNYITTYIEDLGEIFGYDAAQKLYDVQIRVDRYPIHAANGNMQFEKGDDSAYLALTVPKPSRFFEELLKGEYVRIKMVNPYTDETYYQRFSLAGSSDAISRAYNLCQKYSQPSDKKYFNDDDKSYPKHQDDAEYL